MNIARISRFRSRVEDQEEVIGYIREVTATSRCAAAILVDLQGSKIRPGWLMDDQKAILNKDDESTITTDDVLGTARCIFTISRGLPGDHHPGDWLLIDDGSVAVRVVTATGTDIVTKIEAPGYVPNDKGINLPGTAVFVPAPGEKGREDLYQAPKIGADLIALLLVRGTDNIRDVHGIVDGVGVCISVIAKIEKPQATENLFDVVFTFDGIMVVRGDLGVEMFLETVPSVQKRAIGLARHQTKPVIMTTQVLEPMIQNPRPTRVEVSDCANAILDGTGAAVLSGKASMGVYPIGAVYTMASIIENVEKRGGEHIPDLGSHPQTHGGALTRAAAKMGEHLDTICLVTLIQSGDTA